jgi:hypothetical protein
MGTTAADAARWLMLNLNGGEIEGRRIISKDIADSYFTKQSDLPKPSGRIRIEEGFALGWQVGKYRDPSRPYCFHGGGYTGASTYFAFLPSQRIGVAVLTNTSGPASGITAIVSIDIFDRLLGETGHSDLLPAYEEDVKEYRSDPRSRRPQGVNPSSARDGLSRPANDYYGVFSDPMRGDIEVFEDDRGELAARSGDMLLRLTSRGTDQFTAYIAPGMVSNGSFELDAAGHVAAMVLSVGDGESTRFARVRR